MNLLPQKPEAPRIVDAVFGLPSPERRRRYFVAVLLGLLAHGSLGFWAQRSGESLAKWSERMAEQVHAELSRMQTVDMVKPQPPAPKKEPARPKPRMAVRPVSREFKPPPPAKAASVIARQLNPEIPVDLSSASFVTGTADVYVGGFTMSKGTSTVAVMTREFDTDAHPSSDLSSTVTLDDQNWNCPWPREAEAEQIDQQVVVIRVKVQPDGSVDSARLIADPGHGFGSAALACAKQTVFSPEHDREGRPRMALSPPIRVTFTR